MATMMEYIVKLNIRMNRVFEILAITFFMLRPAAIQCQEPGNMTNGMSQASMRFESFPDKPRVITELSAVQTSDWQAYQSGGGKG